METIEIQGGGIITQDNETVNTASKDGKATVDTVADLLKKYDKNGVESVDTLIMYAKHLEGRNGELFDWVNELKAKLEKYAMALTKIRMACKGCPAYYIAMEVLMDDDMIEGEE